MPRTSVWSRGINRFLASPLVDALTAPHGVDRFLDQINPMWSVGEVRARVVGVTRGTADSVTLKLQPNRNWQGFRAGQYVRVQVEIDGVQRSRCYSLSGAAADGQLEITVKRQDAGLVSSYVNQHARVGQVFTISQAEGDFALPAERPQRLLLIGGGSGITPLMAMLRTLDAENHAGSVDLLYYSRTAQDTIFAAELAQLAAARPQWKLQIIHTQAKGAQRLCARQLNQLVPQYAMAQTFVCGPASLIATVETLWREKNIEDRLHVERFTAAVNVPISGDATVGDIAFARSERYVANDGRSLLDQAEAAGLRPESGCRMGICHSCTCRKSSGTVRNLLTGQLSSEAEDIQICISVAVGDVTLDI